MVVGAFYVVAVIYVGEVGGLVLSCRHEDESCGRIVVRAAVVGPLQDTTLAGESFAHDLHGGLTTPAAAGEVFF